MPELPDVVTYIDSLEKMFQGKCINKIVVKSPFVLRTFEPQIQDCEGKTILEFKRFGKRIAFLFENQIAIVFHLMIAGRFHCRKPARMPTGKNDLVAFQFDDVTLMLTEASSKKRAAIHVVPTDQLQQFDSGAFDLLTGNVKDFEAALKSENRTLKRALTNPRKFDGIGNAYSDEILLLAKLSPFKRTQSLQTDEVQRLFETARQVLLDWIDRLKQQSKNKFPEKVTAFHPEMVAHGRFGQPCTVCETTIQRVVYAENEMNYCPRCQTEGKILADRSLSRLLKDDWPKTIDDLVEDES